MKVYGPSFNQRVQKLLLAAEFAGVKLEQEDYFPREASEAAKNEYKKKNPNGKIPVLETEHGYLFESNAILRYIARLNPSSKLYGSSKYEESLVDQYLDWLISSVEPVYYHIINPIRGRWPSNKEVFDKAIESLKEQLKITEEILKVTQYLIGNTLTIADIFLAELLSFIFRYALDEKGRKPFPNLVKYYLNLANTEQFRRVVGRPALCKNAFKPYFDPAEAAAAKKKKGGKDEKKGADTKEEKKEAEPAAKKEDKKDKKTEKKEAAPKKEKEAAPKKEKEAKPAADDEDDEKPKEKKEKNPLDSLPPSPFNLFDFKTLIVNAPEKKEAVKFFFDNFDPEGYSIWFISYDKAEGEGRVLFLTNNLMKGFTQRLEHFRKYAFGVHGVYGEEPNLDIRGVWVWRGTEIPQEIKENPSYDFYKFVKLDSKNEADRKKLEEFWCGMNEDEDIVDGLRARTVNFFK